MIKVMGFVLASTMLASVAAHSQTSPLASAVPASAQRPQYGDFGFDSSGMDRNAIPGDNFYEYANGTWAKNTPIPADKSNYGAFTTLDADAPAAIRSIVEETAAKSQKPGNDDSAML